MNPNCFAIFLENWTPIICTVLLTFLYCLGIIRVPLDTELFMSLLLFENTIILAAFCIYKVVIVKYGSRSAGYRKLQRGPRLMSRFYTYLHYPLILNAIIYIELLVIDLIGFRNLPVDIGILIEIGLFFTAVILPLFLLRFTYCYWIIFLLSKPKN